MKRECSGSGKPSGTIKQSGKCKQALKRERPTKSASNSKGNKKDCASDASSKRISSGRCNNKPPSATIEHPPRPLEPSKDSKSSHWSASHLSPNPNVSTGLSSQKNWKGKIPHLTQNGRIQAPAPPHDRALKGRRLTPKWNGGLQDDTKFYGPEDADVSDAYESDCLAREQEKETSEISFSTFDAYEDDCFAKKQEKEAQGSPVSTIVDDAFSEVPNSQDCNEVYKIPESVLKHEDDLPASEIEVVRGCTIEADKKEKALVLPNADCLDAEEGVDIMAGIVKVSQPSLSLSKQEDMEVHPCKELNAVKPMENDDMKEQSSEADSDVSQPFLLLSKEDNMEVQPGKEFSAVRPMENDDIKEHSSEADSDDQCVISFKVECQILREEIEAGDLKTSSHGGNCTETGDQEWPESTSVAGSDDSWSGIDLSDTECEEWEDDWLIVDESS